MQYSPADHEESDMGAGSTGKLGADELIADHAAARRQAHRWSVEHAPIRLLFACAALTVLVGAGACYTAAEMQQVAEKAEDPRQKAAGEIWDAMVELATEQAWELDLSRREDLFMTTTWREVEPGLEKRVRLSVVMAEMGVGINADVAYRRDGEELTDAESVARSKREERELVQSIHQRWRGR